MENQRICEITVNILEFFHAFGTYNDGVCRLCYCDIFA